MACASLNILLAEAQVGVCHGVIRGIIGTLAGFGVRDSTSLHPESLLLLPARPTKRLLWAVTRCECHPVLPYRVSEKRHQERGSRRQQQSVQGKESRKGDAVNALFSSRPSCHIAEHQRALLPYLRRDHRSPVGCLYYGSRYPMSPQVSVRKKQGSVHAPR
jgi:hypothetical protein